MIAHEPKKNRQSERERMFAYLVVAEIVLFIILVLSISLPAVQTVFASVVNESNVTVTTQLKVGNVFPEIINITLDDGNASIDLRPNATKIFTALIVIRDWNGEANIQNVSARFFDAVGSSYGGTADNNDHYRNNTCGIDTDYGDEYHVMANCTFSLQYYANNASWNFSVEANDNTSLATNASQLTTINQLLALGLPSLIDYGTINASEVSNEKIANVTNMGNVRFNLSISGYAVTASDGLAMNCSLGTSNISIEHEKYNVTITNGGNFSIQATAGNYTNLSNTVFTRPFNLNYRQLDAQTGVDDTNETFWRIYVPAGAAGNCSGNVVFGAVLTNAD